MRFVATSSLFSTFTPLWFFLVFPNFRSLALYSFWLRIWLEATISMIRLTEALRLSLPGVLAMTVSRLVRFRFPFPSTSPSEISSFARSVTAFTVAVSYFLCAALTSILFTFFIFPSISSSLDLRMAFASSTFSSAFFTASSNLDLRTAFASSAFSSAFFTASSSLRLSGLSEGNSFCIRTVPCCALAGSIALRKSRDGRLSKVCSPGSLNS